MTEQLGRVRREWRHLHSDGSQGFIEELPSGPYLAADIVPVGSRMMRQTLLGQFDSVADAMAAADEGARARGHVCGEAGCASWNERPA